MGVARPVRRDELHGLRYSRPRYWTAGSGAYAMVGMAAFFAATAKAPTTSILILFEMTNDY
ncbi:MAG: chloride channel protein [Acidobacteriota bacterium]|nr:chloride channel protein [Acidobacteriota bacterium]